MQHPQVEQKAFYGAQVPILAFWHESRKVFLVKCSMVFLKLLTFDNILYTTALNDLEECFRHCMHVPRPANRTKIEAYVKLHFLLELLGGLEMILKANVDFPQI